MSRIEIAMAYFNYHAKARKMIKNGELINFEIVDDHNGISPALVLFFKNHKPMPIRQNRWEEYFELFHEMDNKKDE